jgi:two-component system nitrogen regulation sensor histidine kinase GlnL
MSRAEISLAGGGTAGLTLGAVRDTGGALTGAVLLLRDLTAFERSDERQRLQERLAALGEMAAGMAHEIRNPLAGMEVIAGLLRRRVVGEERELAVELSEQIRNVADTVTASLDFVRPLEPRGRTLDIRSLLDEALRQGTARRSLALTVERDISSPLPEVRGDASLLTTALASLVANACEAMAACDGASGAHLLLRVRSNRVLSSGPQEPVLHPPAAPVVREVAAAPEIVISVEDSGPGIAPSEHERIFYPFYTTKQQGSGIGLAQAQKIAMAHGGGVRVESGSGRGATFHMHLPAIGVER